jgi:hypothetical protein
MTTAQQNYAWAVRVQHRYRDKPWSEPFLAGRYYFLVNPTIPHGGCEKCLFMKRSDARRFAAGLRKESTYMRCRAQAVRVRVTVEETQP